ncbi:MAG: RHS repeat-associated core domain-containing protein [Candidatus Sumerlaeaceae bacterium]
MEAFGTVKTGSQSGAHLTTKEWDADATLYYFSARWYAAPIGRLLQLPPYPPWEEQPYTYAGNLPTWNVDPTGEFLTGCTPRPTPTPGPTPPPCLTPAAARSTGHSIGHGAGVCAGVTGSAKSICCSRMCRTSVTPPCIPNCVAACR